MTNRLELRAGIWVIGSLLWDSNQIRHEWRGQRLFLDQKVLVHTPIRYGRISRGERKSTFTMVFSRSCYNARLGQAFIIPTKTNLNSFGDIEMEAIRLWWAETNGGNEAISAGWGSVALLINPNSKHRKNLTAFWENCYARLTLNRIPNFQFLKSEGPPISETGFLRVKWPTLRGGKPLELDVIFATATSANLEFNRYHTPMQIAKTFHAANYYDYFQNNRAQGILTYQDNKIINAIKKLEVAH